jgi:hypothetical protein
MPKTGGRITPTRDNASYFYFRPEEESEHHHPENCDVPGYVSQSSMNLIIEADSTWGAESAA